MTEDERFMDLAVAAARGVLGTTAPNPSVGAVIVRDGVILGVGATRPVGGPHAEVMAIRAAREAGHDLRGATIYVTLEPCRHHGRTPPCTGALLEAGLARAVVGAVDPYPPMRGQALHDLRAAGLEVRLGVRGAACEEVIRGFSRAVRLGLPEVTVKIAASVDGAIATARGESQWITGPEARAAGHALRATHDAVLVGIGTALADDPALTTRDAPGPHAVPVVLDTSLRLPSSARLLHGPRRAIAIAAEDATGSLDGADVLRVPRAAGGVDLEAALRALAGRGLHRVLVEGGARVARGLIDARLVDRLTLFLAPIAIPGGRPWLDGVAVERLADAPRWHVEAVSQVGTDVRVDLRLPHREEG